MNVTRGSTNCLIPPHVRLKKREKKQSNGCMRSGLWHKQAYVVSSLSRAVTDHAILGSDSSMDPGHVALSLNTTSYSLLIRCRRRSISISGLRLARDTLGLLGSEDTGEEIRERTKRKAPASSGGASLLLLGSGPSPASQIRRLASRASRLNSNLTHIQRSYKTYGTAHHDLCLGRSLADRFRTAEWPKADVIRQAYAR